MQTFDTKEDCIKYLESQGCTPNESRDKWSRIIWRQGDSHEKLILEIQEYCPEHVQAKRAKVLELEIEKGDLHKQVNELTQQISRIEKQIQNYRSDLKKYE